MAMVRKASSMEERRRKKLVKQTKDDEIINRITTARGLFLKSVEVTPYLYGREEEGQKEIQVV